VSRLPDESTAGARVWLDLPGEAVVRPTPGEALDALASDLMAQALTCAGMFGDFHLAVGGDAALERVCLRLMSDPVLRAMPWARTHLWLAHERPGADGPAVYSIVRDYLVDHAGIPTEQIHPIDLGPGDAAQRYEEDLRECLGARARGRDRLDAAVVALDAQGRLAGLASFGEGSPDAPAPWCARDPAGGVTMTGPFLRAARLLAVFAVGADQGRALARWADGAPPTAAGETRWYLDQAAAGA